MATTKKRNLSPKQKPVPEPQPTEARGLQTLTIAELDAIAGAALSANHNETMVKFPHLSQKPKPSLEDKPAKVRGLQALTIAELDAPREADL